MRKTRLHLLSAALIAACMILVVASCHKKDTTEDTGFAADHAVSEQTFNDVQSVSDQAAAVTGSSLSFRTAGTTIGGCATVTRTPGVITIDFGATDCLCRAGRTRRGKIIITYSGTYTDIGYTHTITFDNFYQNDNKV